MPDQKSLPRSVYFWIIISAISALIFSSLTPFSIFGQLQSIVGQWSNFLNLIPGIFFGIAVLNLIKGKIGTSLSSSKIFWLLTFSGFGYFFVSLTPTLLLIHIPGLSILTPLLIPFILTLIGSSLLIMGVRASARTDKNKSISHVFLLGVLGCILFFVVQYGIIFAAGFAGFPDGGSSQSSFSSALTIVLFYLSLPAVIFIWQVIASRSISTFLIVEKNLPLTDTATDSLITTSIVDTEDNASILIGIMTVVVCMVLVFFSYGYQKHAQKQVAVDNTTRGLNSVKTMTLTPIKVSNSEVEIDELGTSLRFSLPDDLQDLIYFHDTTQDYQDKGTGVERFANLFSTQNFVNQMIGQQAYDCGNYRNMLGTFTIINEGSLSGEVLLKDIPDGAALFYLAPSPLPNTPECTELSQSSSKLAAELLVAIKNAKFTDTSTGKSSIDLNTN